MSFFQFEILSKGCNVHLLKVIVNTNAQIVFTFKGQQFKIPQQAASSSCLNTQKCMYKLMHSTSGIFPF